jgi:hypothetical protein
MTSIGLRPAVLFLSLTGVKTAASISARKLSNGTTRAIISSGSPFAVIAASRLSASKNPNCPIVPTRESCCHHSDSHKFADVAIFQGALNPLTRSLAGLFHTAEFADVRILRFGGGTSRSRGGGQVRFNVRPDFLFWGLRFLGFTSKSSSSNVGRTDASRYIYHIAETSRRGRPGVLDSKAPDVNEEKTRADLP